LTSKKDSASLKKYSSIILDKNLDIRQRLNAYIEFSNKHPMKAFPLTLELLVSLDSTRPFKGYRKNLHYKESTEFLLFRKHLRSNINKNFYYKPMEVKSKIHRLRTKKNLEDNVKKEIEDIDDSLTNKKDFLWVDLPFQSKKELDKISRILGITYDEAVNIAISESNWYKKYCMLKKEKK